MLRPLTEIVAVFCSFVFSSCLHLEVQKLPAFDQCVAMGPAGETRTVWIGEVAPDALPTLVPFATATGIGGTTGSAPLVISDKFLEMKPDLITVNEGRSVYTGSVTSASGGYGYATAVSTPMFERTFSAACYRLSPVRIGLKADESGMVTAVDDTARACGVIEGDHLVSLGGSPITTGANSWKSEHFRKLLSLKPGEEVKLIWIRPGTGRMEGMLKCEPNPPTHLQLADACAEERQKREATNRDRGAGR